MNQFTFDKEKYENILQENRLKIVKDFNNYQENRLKYVYPKIDYEDKITNNIRNHILNARQTTFSTSSSSNSINPSSKFI